MPGIMIVLKYPEQLFLFNRDGENVPKYSVLINYLRKYMQNGKNDAKLEEVLAKSLPGLGENDGKIISTWNLGRSQMVRRPAGRVAENRKRSASQFLSATTVSFAAEQECDPNH